MPVSNFSLAKKIKKMIQAQSVLRTEDGTAELPDFYQFNFGGEEDETMVNITTRIKLITQYLAHTLRNREGEQRDALTPNKEDVSREAQKKRNTLFTLRALHSLGNSPRGLKRHAFQTRTFTHDDVYEAVNLDYHMVTQCLEDSSGMFQFKRSRDIETNPWNYTWSFIVDGVNISRGTDQPIHKFLSALMKNVDMEEVGQNTVQEQLAELSTIRNEGTKYYWYVSNQDTVAYYHAFRDHANLGTCMSKDHSFYDYTGRGQHPMDCYDDSPDWRLLMFSTKSPEEIVEHCDMVIANPDNADDLFEFPFLTRCMALPAIKETSGRNITTPYVMGKFYGNEKLVRFFLNEGNNGPYVLNDNGFLSGMHNIAGGRIHALKSTKDGYQNVYLLPYFDKANKARLHKEDGTEYWISTYDGDYEKYQEPMAKGSYERGTAVFQAWYSPSCGHHYGINTTTPNTFTTIFGEELETFRDTYQDVEINGVVQSVPNNMFVNVEGQRVLRGATVSLFDGTSVLMESTINDAARFARVDGFGLFDLNNANHVNTYNAIEEAMSQTNPAEVPLPEAETQSEQTGSVFS